MCEIRLVATVRSSCGTWWGEEAVRLEGHTSFDWSLGSGHTRALTLQLSLDDKTTPGLLGWAWRVAGGGWRVAGRKRLRSNKPMCTGGCGHIRS